MGGWAPDVLTRAQCRTVMSFYSGKLTTLQLNLSFASVWVWASGLSPMV